MSTLKEPEELLQTLHRSLSPHGVLLVTVPKGLGPREVFVTKPVINLQRNKTWFGKILFHIKRVLNYNGTTIQSDADDLTHIQFFAKKDFEKLAARNNFKLVKFAVTKFIDDVFPFSFITKKSTRL